MTNAILLSGFLKAYKESFPEFVRLLVKPANAHVFCVFRKNSSIVCRSTKEKDLHDEEDFLRKHLGENLKVLIWIDEVETTKYYIEKGNNYLENLWLPKYGLDFCKQLEHWMNLQNTVDQYQRLRLACREMEKFSKENSVYYNKVLRARPDIYPLQGPKNWWYLDVKENDIFIQKHIRYEFRDMLFLTSQKSMVYICDNFPENYPRYMPTTGENPSKTILSPECQLLQFMIKEHKFNFFEAKFSPTVDFIKINSKNLQLMYWEDKWDIYPKKKSINLEEL
jgi:hypothetical protein